jgi:hypothetical protein
MSAKAQPLTDIGKFYKQVGDFKDKLVNILGQFNKQQEIIDLNKYYDKLMDFKKVNVRKPIELFYQYGVIAYVDDILKRDETIFLDNVSELITVQESGDQQSHNQKSIDHDDVMFVSHIRQIWADLQQPIRENIWNYIQVISILAEHIVGGDLLVSRRAVLKSQGQIK